MKEVREMQGCTEGRPSTQASADSGFPLPGAPVLCPQLREQPNPKLFFFFSYWSKNGPIFLTETSCLGQKMTPGRGSPWHPLPGLPAEGSLVAGPGSPCGQPTRFLAYSPWPGQPLFGAGLVN